MSARPQTERLHGLPQGATELEMHAVVASLDGSRAIRYKKVGARRDAAGLGRQVAEQLLKSAAFEREAGRAVAAAAAFGRALATAPGYTLRSLARR